MVQLSQENIAFIDRYLENSNVVYADIRMEMVDHVASDIEIKMSEGDNRSFPEIFKDYMAVNKLRLLDSQRSTINELTKKLAIKAFKKVFEFQYVFGFLFFAALYAIALEFFDLVKSVWIHMILNLCLILGFILVYEYQRRKRNMPRFSGIERLGIALSILVQIVFFTFNIKGLYTETFNLLYSVVFSFQLMVTVAFLQIGVEQYRIYKANFHFNQ